MQRDYGLSDFLSYQQAGGSEADRGVAADWLRRRVRTAEADRLLIFPGTQTALMALLLSLTKPGDVVLTDRLTYPGFKSAAAALGVRLVGVAADADGHDPGGARGGLQAARAEGRLSRPDHPQSDDAHDAAGAARATRRRDPQVHDLLLFEDDAYGAFDPKARADRHAHSRAQLSRRDPVQMHRARPARLSLC